MRGDRGKAANRVEQQHETDAQDAATVPFAAHGDQPQVDQACDHFGQSMGGCPLATRFTGSMNLS